MTLVGLVYSCFIGVLLVEETRVPGETTDLPQVEDQPAELR